MPLHADGWHGESRYAEVRAGDGADAAALHPDRTPFLSGPPYAQDVGARILTTYRGDHIIYIGEAGATPATTSCVWPSRRRGPKSIATSRCSGGAWTTG